MQAIIYGLYDPSEIGPPHIRYVGYTSKDPGVRIVEHISESKLKASNHRHKWIRSLVRDNVRPAILILELIDEGVDWKEREREWISKLAYLVWITDEVTSKYHPKDDPIPEGWRRGMAFIPRKKPT